MPCLALPCLPQGRQLSLLSKDFNRSEVAASQFLINGWAALRCMLW